MKKLTKSVKQVCGVELTLEDLLEHLVEFGVEFWYADNEAWSPDENTTIEIKNNKIVLKDG